MSLGAAIKNVGHPGRRFLAARFNALELLTAKLRRLYLNNPFELSPKKPLSVRAKNECNIEFVCRRIISKIGESLNSSYIAQKHHHYFASNNHSLLFK